MGMLERVRLYREIEERRKRPLIAYFTSQRPGANGRMAGDVVSEFIDQLQKIPDTDSIDLLIESSGGDALVAWRVMSILREKIETISVLVPCSAFSAATLLALGGDEIVMGRYGCLGPIDPQISVKNKDGNEAVSSYQDFVSYLDFFKKEAGVTHQEHTEKAFLQLCDNVDPWKLGMARRASSLSVTIAEKLLQTHMTTKEEKIRATDIAKKLNESFFSHGHALGRREAKQIGLKVSDADVALENLVWKIHEDVEKDLKFRQPFDPISLFLSDPQAAPYLQSPPPIHIPPQIPQQVAIQLLQEYFNRQMNVTLPKIGINLTFAIMESTRHVSAFEMESQILLMRTLDLKFLANRVDLKAGWVVKTLPQTGTGG